MPYYYPDFYGFNFRDMLKVLKIFIIKISFIYFLMSDLGVLYDIRLKT
jgi:hypothetical protein